MERHPADRLAESPEWWAVFLRCYQIARGRPVDPARISALAANNAAIAKAEGR